MVRQRMVQLLVERLAEALQFLAADPVQRERDGGPVAGPAVGQPAHRQLQRHLIGRIALRVVVPAARHQQRRRTAAAPGGVGRLAVEQLFDRFGAAPTVNLQDVTQICQRRALQPVADLHPDRAARRTFAIP